MDRQRVSSGAVWEERFGYSRAVRVGDVVHVAGTLAIEDDGSVHSPHDAHAQTVFALRKIERALGEVGTSLADIVRVRMYVTDIGDQLEVGRGHAEVLGHVRPAATMVQVGPLAADGALVEVEIEAVVDRSAG